VRQPPRHNRPRLDAPTPSGDKLAVTITLTIEIDDATALDLIAQAIGAFARKSGVDR
jgi:hypothetical protein